MTEAPCESFQWIGQPVRSCDRCGHPAWEHDYDDRKAEGGVPFDPLIPTPWPTDVITAWLEMGRIDRHRATIMLARAEDVAS